jgi:hypothetical protein
MRESGGGETFIINFITVLYLSFLSVPFSHRKVELNLLTQNSDLGRRPST